jgi:hypothetical protein
VTGSNLQFEVLQRLSCTYRAPYSCVNRAIYKHFDEFLLWLRRFYDVSSRSFNIPDEDNIGEAAGPRYSAHEPRICISDSDANSAPGLRGAALKLPQDIARHCYAVTVGFSVLHERRSADKSFCIALPRVLSQQKADNTYIRQGRKVAKIGKR